MTDDNGDAARKDGLEQVPDETRAKSSRVKDGGYECLDEVETKNAYAELDGVLNSFADIIIHSLDQMVPYLSEMQSLLSQRGKDRKKILRNAGLPGWIAWAGEYAAKFACSVRTVQEHINLFRSAKEEGETGRNNGKGSGKGKLLKLDHRQQSALVNAQISINDVVVALKNGGDWQTPLAQYEKIAVTPVRLDSFVNALKKQTDWENVLVQLVAKLEQYGDRLPVAVTTEMRLVRKLLEGKSGRQTDVVLATSAVGEMATRGYRVEERTRADAAGVHHAVIRDGDKEPYGFYSTRSEAESVCESLNTSPVASILDAA